MRVLRCLFAVALVCGLSGVAKADAVDFQMVVVDPQPPAYLVHIITDDSFIFSFAPCVSPGQIPTGTNFVGCFTGENETGHALTSLQVFVPFIPGQVAGCALSGTGLDLFTTVTCGSVPGGYLLNFSGGSIPSGDGDHPDDDHADRSSIFTIAEAGVDPSAFPEVTANFDPVPGVPEPSSVLLLSTGVLMGAAFLVADRRKRLAYAERP